MSGQALSIRVLVVARQPMARAGLRGLLADRGDLQVVGQARSADEAIDILNELAPDLVLVALQSDEVRGTSILELVSRRAAPVVLVADLPSAPALRAMLGAGLRGFLLPEATADEVSAALLAVAQGLTVLSPAVGGLLTNSGEVVFSENLASMEELTEREREVLRFLAAGLPNKTIATRLQISEHTVKFHVGAILAKLGATSRTEAVTRAVRQGLIAL